MKKYFVVVCLMATAALAASGVKPNSKGGAPCRHQCDLVYHAEIESCRADHGAGVNNEAFQACAMEAVSHFYECVSTCPNH